VAGKGDVGSLLEAIYETVGEETYWLGIANSIGLFMGGGATVGQVMLGNLAAGKPDIHFASDRITDAAMADYRQHYVGMDYRIPYVASRRGTLLTGVEGAGEEAFDRSALANEFLDRKDVDCRYCLAQVDIVDGSLGVLSAALRPRSSGAYDDAEYRRMQMLLPQIRQTARLHQKLTGTAMTLARITSAFNMANDAMFVVDRRSVVKVMNAAAERLLSGDGRVTLSSGCLQIAGPALQAAFVTAVRDAATMRDMLSSPEPADIVIPAKAASQSAIVLSILPMARAAIAGSQVSNGEVLVTCNAIPQTASRRMSLLRASGLTQSEIAVAVALSDGKSLADIAAARSVALETVRTQAKSAWRKMGGRGQADLIRLVRQV
jgi:DNA-binding NarL/FixJ family response regulator